MLVEVEMIVQVKPDNRKAFRDDVRELFARWQGDFLAMKDDVDLEVQSRDPLMLPTDLDESG